MALGAFALATMGQEGCAETTSDEEPTVQKGKQNAAAGGSDTIAEVGDRVTLKGTTYKVTSVDTAKTLGDNPYTKEKANGQFVIVKLQLTNKKDEPATILEDNIRLIGGNGKNYSTSDDALFAVEDAGFILEEIQPDNTEKGTLVYDLPKKAVSGAQLQVSDLFSDSTARIELGL